MGLSRADEIFPRYIIDGLPPGFSGFIVAGLLAAALSTLAGSISSMASSTTLDLIKPYLSKALRPEKEIFLSRVVTIGFAAALVGSAMFFMNTTQTVVELALSISSFTYGGLLGTFLLGALFRRPREEDALAGFAAGIFIMISVISLKLVAWTWYTLVGVLATVAIGLLLSSLSRASGEAGPGRSRGSAAPK
jgi:Na+/proline symporter